MYKVYNLRETRIYYQHYIKEKNNNYLITNTAYLLQYSDTYVY